MKKIGNKIKTFFLTEEQNTHEAKETKINYEKILDNKGLYVLKLDEVFKKQFPLKLKDYIQLDTQSEESYTLTDKIYKDTLYGHKVMFTLNEATYIKKKLNKVPLDMIQVTERSD